MPPSPTRPPLRLLLVGGSGAVGQAVLAQALADARIGRVIAPSRRALATQHSKLHNPLHDFSGLTALPTDWACDALVCTLGSTRKAAGSAQAFAAIDRDLPITLARLAQAAGARSIGLNSSLGASLHGNFYLRTKAEAENGIIALGFASTTLVRPALIDTARAIARPAEQIGLWFAHAARPLLPRRYRAVSPAQIASALLQGVISAAPGVQIIESEALHEPPAR